MFVEVYTPAAKEHLELIDGKLEEMRVRVGRAAPHTLTGLIDAWRDLVALLEEGYEDSVDEYSDYLSVRDLLDELLAVIPAGSVRDRVAREIAETDEHYRRVTREVDDAPFGAGEWWWRRVPNVLLGELRDHVVGELGK